MAPRKPVAVMSGQEVHELTYDWRIWAREEQQLPPLDRDWRTWLILGGRGAGKTRAGAEWVRARALGLWPMTGARAERIALVAPTFDEARLVMVEGKSGLLAIHPDGQRPHYEPSKRQLTWHNGSIAQIFSADTPESLRGPQFDAAWCDELAKWRYGEEAFSMLGFALRLGDNPRLTVTTTPRPTALLKRLLADEATAVSRSRTADNRNNLAKSFLAAMEQRYGGTRLGRQELDGELIDDDPEALFQRDAIEALRARHAPDLARVVVAVDPPASHGKKSNACGIVCVGLGEDGRAYVLDDCSVNGARPAQWAAAVVALWVGETAARTETASPTLAELQFPTMELYAMPAATQTLLDDNAVNLDQWLADEVQRVFAEQESTAFVTGNGTNRPKGFLSYTNVADASWTWGNVGYLATGVAGGFAASNPSDKLIDLPQNRRRAADRHLRTRRPLAGKRMSAAREPFPWRRMMAAGIGILRLSPRAFWNTTPRELAAALGGENSPAMTRADLDRLLKQFPDG